MNPSHLTSADHDAIARRGIPPEEIERQLALFRDPPPPARLVRPCTPEDGVDRLGPERHPGLLARYDRAAAAGRFMKFVPASGAATRMFRTLLSALQESGTETLQDLARRADGGESVARDVVRFVESAERFPFAEALDAVLERRGSGLERARRDGDWRGLLAALLDADGLRADALPKGLLPFHRYPEGSRTAFEEHLAEAAAYAADAQGRAPIHLTVSPEHRTGFEERLGAVRTREEQRLGVRFEVSFSFQDPSTDTLAVDHDNEPFREADGTLHFRPGGHGALLRNLGALDGDLVFVKNIDNVTPDDRRGPTLLWKRLLGGVLLEVEERCHAALDALDAGGPDPEPARELVARFIGTGDPAWRRAVGDGTEPAFLRERLDRPMRVCGVVRNEGEPGGGPFWVRDPEGHVTRQIVESSQVDLQDPDQKRIWGASTHFNPVDLVCGLRDRRGRPYDLEPFVDPRTVFISRKSRDGRELKALERPGLWNGAMARWNTLFVEVPIQTFTPVKTVFDLLREQHQPPAP